MSFELLSEPIRRYIRDQRWDALRPIQNAAIARILTTEDHYILAAHTASGKTEAAFLPILSRADFREPGVQVLYISPLIALINDQFLRVEDLCRHIEVTVTKWHSEASAAAKQRLIKKPEGIMLITPESMEAMLVNHPYNAKALFAGLKFVVIDEIHSFIGTERGMHLQSLLHRIADFSKTSVRFVGLSATLGDFEEAKRFMGHAGSTKILLDKTKKEIDATFHFQPADAALPPEFLVALYESTHRDKVLIFPNSRGRVEEIAVGLKKIAERRGGHARYFSHHSSVDRELREYVETFAKTNKHQPYAIVCTSTLELGIDIGMVDTVVQIDATHSIASLIQRIGRSGRREGARSVLLLYATDSWELLQAGACWELFGEGFIEPVKQSREPFDLLFHQILSMLKQTNGLTLAALLVLLGKNPAFGDITVAEMEELIRFMIEQDYIEDLKRELIIGLEGAKLASDREFYSMFTTDSMLKVVHAGNKIGEVPFSPQIAVDENILLAAQIWKIKDVDQKAMKILVDRAHDGKRPIFSGSRPDVHHRIREQMLDILYSDRAPAGFDQTALDCLNEQRFEFQSLALQDLSCERPAFVGEKTLRLYTFAGSRINRTLSLLLRVLGIKHELKEESSCFEIRDASGGIDGLVRVLREELLRFDEHLARRQEECPLEYGSGKWGHYLPLELQRRLIAESLFDLGGAEALLTKVRFVTE